MNKFAAIVDHDTIGQVLIVRSQNMEEKPQVQVSFMIEDMKVGPEYSWEADDNGIEQRDKFWNSLQNDETQIDKYVLPIYTQLKTQIDIAKEEGTIDNGHDTE